MSMSTHTINSATSSSSAQENNPHHQKVKIDPAVGFTLSYRTSPTQVNLIKDSQNRAIGHFEHIAQTEIQIGSTRLWLWGHGDLSSSFSFMADGSLLALIGSPVGKHSWVSVEEELSRLVRMSEFELPWEGRVVLLRISADGQVWTMWNDWVGAIPVFHGRLTPDGRVASTLEPVAVAAAQCTPEDVFLPALLSLLIHGNFLGDWTLYRTVKVVPPDSVAEWNEAGFRWDRLFTVKPTEKRWEEGWDELVDEMYELSRQSIINVLKTRSSWILPLSGGLDSRLIAVVAAEQGVNVSTFTWGARSSRDAIYARQIANTLKLPWAWIDLGTDYLVKYLRLWADLFGSAMHFHGMYQMPFLDSLDFGPESSLVSGFLGEVLAGYAVRFQMLLHSPHNSRYHALPDGYLHWTADEMNTLFKKGIENDLDELAAEIEAQTNAVTGSTFQRLSFLTLWGRQHHFTYFQTMLSDYWAGVATPYLDRNYARFCMSLPRVALEERRLQSDLFRRCYGSVATIPVSYYNRPLIDTGRYLLKRRIAQNLPDRLLRGPLQSFNTSPLSRDGECVKRTGTASFWPVFDVWDKLTEWFDMNQIEAVYGQARSGDIGAVRRLQSVQALALRLLPAR